MHPFHRMDCDCANYGRMFDIEEFVLKRKEEKVNFNFNFFFNSRYKLILGKVPNLSRELLNLKNSEN